MSIDFRRMRDCLAQFDFHTLFVNELGWSQPASRQEIPFSVKDQNFSRRSIAQLAGVVILEITADQGQIPDAKLRAAIHKEIAKQHHENVLIFVDRERTQSLWYWVKRQDGKSFVRDHLFAKGQPGDLFVSKLVQMNFDLGEFDAEGNVSIVEVARKLRSALHVERVTKKFYGEFQEQHIAFLGLIRGVPDDRQRRWYASVLLNRLMFIYFLQKKRFLDSGNVNYLEAKLADSQERGRNQFFSTFLKLLFFEGFAKPEEKRSREARERLGAVKYLNGGLFLPHHVEQHNPKLDVPDKAFENLFDLFRRYSWNLNDTPGGEDNEINPDVLGYIFEKYINQKAFGAYYTRPEITEYLCERTIHQLILDAVNTPEDVKEHAPGIFKSRQYQTLAELLLDLDASFCKRLLHEVLPGLSLLDPACGSGAFLVAAMKTLINVYAAVIGKIKFLGNRNLSNWLAGIEREHKSVNYFIKKKIITDNLYGVDIMEEATEIARLRLFLALVAAADSVDQLEPLPNIDFNILPGNSLIGLMRVDDADFESRSPDPEAQRSQGKLFRSDPKQSQTHMFRRSYRQVLDEKNRLIDNYRHLAGYVEDMTALRDNIEAKKREALETLDDILLAEFNTLDIKYEQTTWDDKKNKEGKPVKRPLKPADIEGLHPFHWGFEFDEILNKRGGFDAIITNPPWEVFQIDEKEFFLEFSDIVTKKNMTIRDFHKEQQRLLKDAETRDAWLEYTSRFPYQSAYFRNASQYRNQISVVNGKRVRTDINLYKLFVEQCLNLLRDGGRCGIIMPGGIYTDLGTKQLRDALLSANTVSSLFGLSNEKFIFEGVHHAQKFCILSFMKGGRTETIEGAFRINPREAVDSDHLDQFFHDPQEHVQIKTALIRRLSPDSLSVMEFRSDLDVQIAEKLLHFPLLGEEVKDRWNIRFSQELNMTSDSHLFHDAPGKGRLPLYEGKMIWQFDHRYAEPRYWVNEKDGRKAVLGSTCDSGQSLDYQYFRFGFRDIASNTNERTAVATVIPPTFHGNKVPTVRILGDDGKMAINSAEQVFLTAITNSFIFDFVIRMRVTTTLNFFYVYQMPVPRLTTSDSGFVPIMRRAAQLICTTPEFDELARDVGMKSHKQGITDLTGRARLRAELDGLVAHLYGLTEGEFSHVLSTFPLVPDPVKVAAHNAYRDAERGLLR